MPRKQHVHKYYLRRTSVFDVWACALDECNHYMPQHLTELVSGRSSLCWDCGAKFRLNEDLMREEAGKPVCQNCLDIRRFTKLERAPQIKASVEPDQVEINEPRLEPVEINFIKCLRCEEMRAEPAQIYDGYCLRCFGIVNGLSQ